MSRISDIKDILWKLGGFRPPNIFDALLGLKPPFLCILAIQKRTEVKCWGFSNGNILGPCRLHQTEIDSIGYENMSRLIIGRRGLLR